MAGGTPLGQMYIELGLDASKFSPTLAGARNAVKYFQSEMRGLDTILKRNGNNMQALSAKSKSLQEAIKAQKKIVEGLKKSYDEADTSAKKDRYATQLANAKAKLQDFQSQLKSVNESIKTSNARMKETGKVDLYQKAKTSAELFESKLRTLDTRLQANGNNLALLAQKNNLLQESYKNQQRVLVELRKAQKLAEPNSPEWDKAAIAIENETARLHELKAELSNVGEEMKKVARENSLLFKAGQRFEKWGNHLQTAGDKLQAMGNAMRPLSTILSGGLTLATKNAIDFESQMNTTKSLLADTIPTAKELNATTEKLGSASKGWAKQYGISTKSINEGMQEIIKKGFDANQTMAAMPAILDASKASGDDFNVVMNASTNILRQFGLEAKDTNRVTDSLTYVANKTSAGFSDMGLAMEYVGPVAHSLNMSLEETSAAIGILSDNGIAGEKAGTALRGALSKLLKPSESNAAAMKELGFSVEEFQSGAIKLPDIIDRIKEATKGWTDEERASAIARAFGVEAQTGMNALINQGGDALRNLTNETKNATGYTKKLADELSKSSKNGVERFKASLEVLGINIGQKLLPKLTPILDWANNMIDKFDKLDPKTQNWLTWLAVGLAGAYPGLNFLGNGLKIIGTASSGIGKTLDWLSKLKTARAASKGVLEVGDSIVKLGSSAGAAASSTSLLSGAVGLLGNPVTWGVLLGGAVILGIGMYAQSVQDAKKRTEEWGTEVSKNQAAKLETFKGKVDEAKQAMIDFGAGAGSVDKVTSSVQKLADEIGKLADKNGKKKVDIAKSLGLSDETIAAIQKNTENIKSNVNQMSNEIGSIYRNASEQHRQLTAEEKAIVTSNMNEMINTQLSLMKFSGKERVKITQAINGELDGLNQTQLSKARETLEGWIKEENKSYEERKSNYKKLLADLKGTDAETVAARQELQQKLEELELEHNAKMEEYGKRWAAIEKKLTEDALKNSNPQAREGILKSLRRAAEELGFSYDEMVEKATNATSKLQEQSTMWAQTTKDASEAQRTANTQWNAMVWDLKEGKLKTNAVEEVQKALQAEGGWDSMQFILKEANLTSNARLTIGEALVANGQWESLSPSEKALVVNGKPAIAAILDSKDLLTSWNSLPTEAKEMLGRNENFLNSAKVAEETLTRWNQLMPEQKDIIARDLASPNAQVAQGAIDSIMGKSVDINAVDKTEPSIASSTYAINSVLQNKPADINAQDNTAEAVFTAQSTMDSLENVTRSLNGENLTQAEKDAAQATLDSLMDVSRQLLASNATGPEKEAAQRTLDSLQDVTRNLKGQNLTASEKDNAQRTLDSLKDVTRSLRASNQTHGGVNDAKNTLSTVHDKTVTITSIFRSVGKFLGFEKGTDFHPGGLSVVNDQKGPLYKELITLPNGRSFVPQGRNVLIDLPRGSKVLPAKQTDKLARKGLLPHYANGVGIPNDAKFIREMEQAQQSIEVRNTTTQTVVDMEKVVSEIAILRSSLEKLLTGILEKPLEVALDGEVLAQNSYQRQARIMAREGI